MLLKDPQVKRNEWPMGLVTKVIPSADGKVRKIEAKTIKQETVKVYLRPISSIVVLLSCEK